MRLHVQIGLEEGETPEEAGISIISGKRTHKLTPTKGACVIDGIAPGATLTLHDDSPADDKKHAAKG